MHYHAWLSKAIRATSTSVFIALSAAFLLISTSQKSYSQNPRAINYSVREGLPSSEVYEIFCDRDGFLWFATDNGVARFDGKDFQKYNVKDSLSDPIVFGFYEDLNGKIWFRTFTGKLSYYANGKITRYPFNGLTAQLANRAIITQIQLDSLNNLWLSLDKNFIQIDSNGNMIQTVAIASRNYAIFKPKFQFAEYTWHVEADN
jgi:ligand-binding sensor domain-containing protein